MFNDTIHTNIRIPKSQADKISKICKQYEITQSHFVRICIDYYLSKNPDKILNRDKKFKEELIYHLLKIGNNINQIAHNFNYIKTHGYTDQTLTALTAADKKLNKCSTQLNEIKNHITKRL